MHLLPPHTHPTTHFQASLDGTALPPVLGMLVFSCTGRGLNLYSEPNKDSEVLASYVRAPSAGFFCNGEIAKVGGSTHLHGFTLAVGMLRAAAEPAPGAEPAAGL